MKLGIVLGTRPEILKNYSTVKALRERGVAFEVLWTGQHTDVRMTEPFFNLLGYRPTAGLTDYRLGRAVDWLVDQVQKLGIDCILVNGDTAAALAGAIAALYSDCKLAHVEAGLRSGDVEMYEERNRIIVDSVAHYLFAYTEREALLLATRDEYRGKIFVVGNTTVDLISDFKDQLTMPVDSKAYAFVTLHRKELTDRPERMISAFDALQALGTDLEVRFPLHPRTLDAIHRNGLALDRWPNIRWMDPLGPFESLAHIRHAKIVLTDSGCVQEEAAILHTPCVTIRENTERPATVEAGINIVSGFDPSAITTAAHRLTNQSLEYPDIYGKPGASHRILDILLSDHNS